LTFLFPLPEYTISPRAAGRLRLETLFMTPLFRMNFGDLVGVDVEAITRDLNLNFLTQCEEFLKGTVNFSDAGTEFDVNRAFFE